MSGLTRALSLISQLHKTYITTNRDIENTRSSTVFITLIFTDLGYSLIIFKTFSFFVAFDAILLLHYISSITFELFNRRPVYDMAHTIDKYTVSFFSYVINTQSFNKRKFKGEIKHCKITSSVEQCIMPISFYSH